jgi:hypothetical protein
VLSKGNKKRWQPNYCSRPQIIDFLRFQSNINYNDTGVYKNDSHNVTTMPPSFTLPVTGYLGQNSILLYQCCPKQLEQIFGTVYSKFVWGTLQEYIRPSLPGYNKVNLEHLKACNIMLLIRMVIVTFSLYGDFLFFLQVFPIPILVQEVFWIIFLAHHGQQHHDPMTKRFEKTNVTTSSTTVDHEKIFLFWMEHHFHYSIDYIIEPGRFYGTRSYLLFRHTVRKNNNQANNSNMTSI